MELRYYKKHEYDRLTGAQKRELREWRESKSSKGSNNQNNRISSLETQIKDLMELNKELAVKISALSTNRNDENGDGNRNPLINPLNQRNSS